MKIYFNYDLTLLLTLPVLYCFDSTPDNGIYTINSIYLLSVKFPRKPWLWHWEVAMVSLLWYCGTQGRITRVQGRIELDLWLLLQSLDESTDITKEEPSKRSHHLPTISPWIKFTMLENLGVHSNHNSLSAASATAK